MHLPQWSVQECSFVKLGLGFHWVAEELEDEEQSGREWLNGERIFDKLVWKVQENVRRVAVYQREWRGIAKAILCQWQEL